MPSKRANRRGIRILWSLLRSFLILILVLAGSIYLLISIRGGDVARRLAGNVVRRSVDRMESDLALFFEPVTATLEIAEGWTTSGALRCGDPTCLNELFVPIMRRTPQIDSVSTSNAQGRGVLLMQTDGGWRNRITNVEVRGELATFVEYDTSLVELSRREEKAGYDPRVRPWYVAAREGEPGRVRWTAPYRFFTSKEPGMSGSIVVSPPGSEDFVLAFDVKLEAITRFTRSLDAGPSGLVFVLSSDARILGVPRHPSLESEEAVRETTLRYVRELDLPVLQAASREAAKRGFKGPDSFPFQFGGERWWGSIRVVKRPGAPELLLGVIASEEDYLGGFRTLRARLGWLTLLAGLAAAFVAGWLARKYSRPVQDLVEKSQRIRGLDLEPQPRSTTRVAELMALDQAQEDMRQALDSFARYVPTDVVRDLLERGQAAQIGGRELTITAMFTDIVGFTSISEGMSATALTEHMSDYFDAMVTTLKDGGATVDKLIGDAIVAFWGAPTADPDHAAHAVESLLRCQSILAEKNRAWEAQGKPRLPTRFGLATGPAVVGNIGAPTRLNYTALGDTMNLASRLEAANRHYETRSLVSQATVDAAGDEFVFRLVDHLAVKGKQEIVRVYEVLGRAEDVPRDDDRKVLLERALELYRARAFEDALALLAPCVESDAVAKTLVQRCREALESPPPDGWDGATRLTRK